MNDIECSSLIQSENENDESGKLLAHAKRGLHRVACYRCLEEVCVIPHYKFYYLHDEKEGQQKP